MTKKHLVVGGAGMIGSRLAEYLSGDVVIQDDLSTGNKEWIPNAMFYQGDVRDGIEASDIDVVWHFAADKNVKTDDPLSQYSSNLDITRSVVEFARREDADLVFASSSTVYGEMEDESSVGDLCDPISAYGAAKRSEELLIDTMVENSWSVRFANIVGGRLRPGAVIPDFVEKLREDPTTLEILGNGKQEKSYIHIDDCIEGIVQIHKNDPGIYNLGSASTVSVDKIAEIITDEMNVSPEIQYTGGDRGWDGDVPKMWLEPPNVDWNPTMDGKTSVRNATRKYIERTQ